MYLASVIEICAEQIFFLHEQKGHGTFGISCSKYYEGIKIKKDDRVVHVAYVGEMQNTKLWSGNLKKRPSGTSRTRKE